MVTGKHRYDVPKKMIAVAKTGKAPGAELITCDVPGAGSHEVLVKVFATSVCGTDAHIYKWNPWAQKRIRLIPQIMGHELCGEVVRIGGAVTSVDAGDYVSADSHISCGTCRPCLLNQRHICTNLKILGVDTNGCFAEYIALPENVIWKNDPSLPIDVASAQEPLGNAIYATLVEPVTDKSVVIFGDGPIGLFSVGVARASGAAQVILVGLDQFLLDIGKKMGADITLHGRNDDVYSKVMDVTGGYGADVILEMAGTQETISLGLKTVRRGGRFSAFGLPPSHVTIDVNNDIIFKGLTLYGITGRLMFDTWRKARELLLSGKLDITPVITHHLPMTEFEKAFSIMHAQPRTAGKIVLYPDTSKIPSQ